MSPAEIVGELETALKADSHLSIHLTANQANLNNAELLEHLFTAAALIYAEATEPKRSKLFDSLLILMEFLRDSRLAVAQKARFELLK